MFNQNCPDLKQLVKETIKRVYVKGNRHNYLCLSKVIGYSWKSLMIFLFKLKNNKKEVEEIL